MNKENKCKKCGGYEGTHNVFHEDIIRLSHEFIDMAIDIRKQGEEMPMVAAGMLFGSIGQCLNGYDESTIRAMIDAYLDAYLRPEITDEKYGITFAMRDAE